VSRDARLDETTRRAYQHAVADLVDDIGRLRRRLARDEDLAHLLERIAFNVETLAHLFEPAAAELVAGGMPVERAIAEVDRRYERIRRQLGIESRG
jgi:hypothetical protein